MNPMSRVACTTTNEYPLKNLAILDSGTMDHVFNEISQFLNFSVASKGDYLWVGDTKVPILGYGDVDICVQGPQGWKIIRLFNVAYCESFATNLVSLRRL